MENKEYKINKAAVKQEKGTWRRFTKLILKSNVPIILVVIYAAMDVFLINVSISETDYTAQLFAGDVSTGLVFKLVVILIANAVLAQLSVLMRQITEARIERNARLSVWKKLLHIPMAFFKDESPQEAITRVVNNSSAVGTALILVVVPFVTSIYGIVASLLKVFDYDWRLSLILVAFMPVSFFLAFITGRLRRSASDAGAGVVAVLTEHISELISNIPLIKAFVKEKREEKRAEKDFDELYRVNIKYGWIDKVGELAFSVSDMLQVIIIVTVGYLLLNKGDISLRAWVSFFMFSGVVSGHINNLVMYWHNSKNIQGIVERASKIMDQQDEQTGVESANELCGDIVFDDVCFSYDENRDILKNVTCTFSSGKITALLGKSGCGKTTITNLIDRIYLPNSGSIFVGDKLITEYELNSYRKKIALLSQEPMLFSGTIRENICFGTEKNPNEAELTEILRKSDLLNFVSELPNGVDTAIGERGDRLSGGQKQKLAIARMMLADAPYVILDESAASMDAVAVGEIRSILEQYLQGKTVIMIAHTDRLLSLAENVVIIENGSVSAEGKLCDIAKTNEFCASVMKGGEQNV